MNARQRAYIRDELVKRAEADEAFRSLLLADPAAAAEQALGFQPPEGFELLAVEEAEDRLYVVLPPRRPGRDATVTLREVTAQTVRDIVGLKVAPEQEGFVAPNAMSIAEAHFNDKAWYRAIYADETPVGFVMLLDDPQTPRYYLWRYMVDAQYQGYGFGRRALEQVIEYVRSRPGAAELTVSYVPGEGSPRDFYARLGFAETGATHGGEREMRLALTPAG